MFEHSEFNQKNILLICKESFAFPMYFISKYLIQNNNVACYFINPMESYYNENLMNENTYFKFNQLEKIQIFDTNDIVNTYTKNLSNPPIDWKYISELDSNYTHFKNLNLQLLTSQMFSTYYHYRTYFVESNYNQQLYWLELNYRNFEKIINEFSPDVILDLDNAELPRSIISEVSRFKNIPYIVIEHPRYENFKIPTYANLWNNRNFIDTYNNFYSKSPDELKVEYEYVTNFRLSEKIMSIEYENQISANYTRDSFLKIIKRIYVNIIYCFNQDVISNNLSKKRKNHILFNSSLKFISYYAKVEIKRWYLFGKNKYFKNPLRGEKYILLQLHLIPESTTLVHAPFYINELTYIEQVSKSLPVGWILYVKEHQVMVGERNLIFYKKVNSLPNVKMVQFNYYKDPKPWIANSEGVITITGTGAYESVLLGKKSIIFGNLPFDLIEGVNRVKSFEDLPNIFKNFGKIDNIHSCAAYIATVKNIGVEFKLFYLMSESEDILKGVKSETDIFKNEVLKLIYFFEKSYYNHKFCN